MMKLNVVIAIAIAIVIIIIYFVAFESSENYW